MGILTTAMLGGTAPTYAANAGCRPDGLYQTPGVNVPYCLAYDSNGRELLGPGNTRRVIGYFTSWRNGSNGQPAYLVPNIPWSNLTTINFAFAHIDPNNQISVNPNSATNPDTGMTWPGVPGAQMDPSLPYQ